MKVAIVGSRGYARLDLVRKYVATLEPGTTVVSGGARGVDEAAEESAFERGLTVQTFRANWRGYGKRAGFMRNTDIVANADRVVAFWDGMSRGTKHTMALARAAKKELHVFGSRGTLVEHSCFSEHLGSYCTVLGG